MLIKCDVCNEPDQEVNKPCTFCEEIVGDQEAQKEADEYDLGDFDEALADTPFSEMIPTD